MLDFNRDVLGYSEPLGAFVHLSKASSPEPQTMASIGSVAKVPGADCPPVTIVATGGAPAAGYGDRTKLKRSGDGRDLSVIGGIGSDSYLIPAEAEGVWRETASIGSVMREEVVARGGGCTNGGVVIVSWGDEPISADDGSAAMAPGVVAHRFPAEAWANGGAGGAGGMDGRVVFSAQGPVTVGSAVLPDTSNLPLGRIRLKDETDRPAVSIRLLADIGSTLEYNRALLLTLFAEISDGAAKAEHAGRLYSSISEIDTLLVRLAAPEVQVVDYRDL